MKRVLFYQLYPSKFIIDIYLFIDLVKIKVRWRPKSKCNDGAWFSFAHCNWHPLILIHQVVFVWVTVNTDDETNKPVSWTESSMALCAVTVLFSLLIRRECVTHNGNGMGL